MQEQKEEQDSFCKYIFSKTKKAIRHAVCGGFVWMKSIVTLLLVMMMEWRTTTGIGVLFSRWQRKGGMRESASSPHLTTLCTLQFRMGLCVNETLGFQGRDKAAEGKERQGWRTGGWGGEWQWGRDKQLT